MAYSKKKKAEVKADFESGIYKSVEELHKKHGVSVRQLEQWIIDNGWKKGSNSEVIEKKIEESTIEMFKRIGLPKETILKKIKEGLEATKLLISGNKEESFAEIIPDHQAIDRYISQFNKMTGGYAAEKIEHSGEISIADQIKRKWSDKK